MRRGRERSIDHPSQIRENRTFYVCVSEACRSERLRAAAATGVLPPDQAERAAALVRRYDEALEAIQRNSLAGTLDAASDEQLQAILADAQAFVRESGWTHEQGHDR